MLRAFSRWLSAGVRLADLVAIAVSVGIAVTWNPLPVSRFLDPEIETSALLTQGALLLAMWCLFATRFGIYQSRRAQGTFLEAVEVAKALGLSVALGSLGVLVVTGSLGYHPLLVFGFGLTSIVGLRVLLRSTLKWLRYSGLNTRRALIVGRGPAARHLLEEVARNRHFGLDVIGALSFGDEVACTDEELKRRGWLPRSVVPDLGTADSFKALLAEETIDRVLVCPSGVSTDGEVEELFRDCDYAGVPYLYAPSYVEGNQVLPTLEWFGGIPMIGFRPGDEPTFQLFVKRAIDVIGAGLALLLLSPLFLVCAIAIRLSDRGPVLFRQVRVGKGGQRFACLKFRSMYMDAEARKAELEAQNEQDGPVFKIRQDPRITAVGRFLRKYSIDELPQLWNVFRGDMSLVGPRPPVPTEVRRYEWWQRRRVAVKPGLTCIWQVWGRNKVSFKRWVEMDLQYIESWSLWLDIKLMLHTFGVVVRGTGM